jgi:serine/threonine-protein kinase
MISPDGRWIAFQSDESGQPEIYIQALSDLSIKERVSVAGGTRPVWHNNGRELFYLSDTRMMSALFNPEEANRLERRALFDLATFDPDVFDIEAPDFSYDYDEKKDQFLFLVGNYSDPVDRIDVVVNWFEELKQLVPASER